MRYYRTPSRRNPNASDRAKAAWVARAVGFGGGRPLACDPDETVTAKGAACVHCQAGLTEADQVLQGRHNKIDLPVAESCPIVCNTH
jgi:hypothetical protein